MEAVSVEGCAHNRLQCLTYSLELWLIDRWVKSCSSRLKTENMEPYFDRKKRLMPRPTDLSFYNWETQTSTSNPTPNFQATLYTGVPSQQNGSLVAYDGMTWLEKAAEYVLCWSLAMGGVLFRILHEQVIADNEAGLLFKNKRDRKVINVDPRLKPGDNSTRTELTTPEFLQIGVEQGAKNGNRNKMFNSEIIAFQVRMRRLGCADRFPPSTPQFLPPVHCPHFLCL
eukprot:859505-Pelagomonas_calceolata.AAC.3